MFLSKEDSTQLWESVKQHNFSLFNPINQKLLNPQGAVLRHLPVRLYLPHAASPDAKPVGKTEQTEKSQNETADKAKREENEIPPGSLRVVQSLITPSLTSRELISCLRPNGIMWLTCF
jgi:autophagy-related protein 5